MTTSSNRNAGNAGSLFVDLKFGEVHRADFIVDGSASQAVLDEIGVRQARAEVWVPKFEEPARPAIDRWPAGDRERRRLRAWAWPVCDGPTQGQTTGGFEPIRQAAGLNSANSNAPEPLPAATDRHAVTAAPTQGAMPPSTALRPMLLVGLLDGAVSFTKVNGGLLAPARPEAVFDREFTRFTGSFNSGQGQYGGRGALFVKGTVATHYLMTFAYDSDKDVRGALFRDINPEAFYPIYGDGEREALRRADVGTFLRARRSRPQLPDVRRPADLELQSGSAGARRLQPGAHRRATPLRELADDGQCVRQP